MEFVVRVVVFTGEVISAWAFAAWGYFQDKLDSK